MRTFGLVSVRNQSMSFRALSVEVLGYAVVSAVALCIDAGILKALVSQAGWHYLPASTLSFMVGAAVAYVLSIRFVFRTRYLTNRVVEFGYFVALGLGGLLVNAVALSVAISWFALGLMVAKLLAALCTFATNYLLRRVLLFPTPRTSK